MQEFVLLFIEFEKFYGSSELINVRAVLRQGFNTWLSSPGVPIWEKTHDGIIVGSNPAFVKWTDWI